MPDLNLIRELAGVQRCDSFMKAAEESVRRGHRHYVETGTYRGIDADGRSSEILSYLAYLQGGTFTSIDLCPRHCELARQRVTHGTVVHADSVEHLRRLTEADFVYLDSYDYEPANPEPSQLHMVAEAGAVLGILGPTALILLDDCNIPGGGKGLLVDRFLRARGWRLLHDGYQKLYSR